MGYYIEQLDCKFFMPKENFSGAISVSKLLLTKETKNKNASGKRMWYSPKNEIKIDKHYAWVNEQEVLNATTFEGVAEAFRWDTEKDSEGNVTDFIFNGQKYGGDELVFLNANAPYVKKGSFIEVQGEEGERWKWYFNGNTCEEYFAEITYPDLEGEE